MVPDFSRNVFYTILKCHQTFAADAIFKFGAALRYQTRLDIQVNHLPADKLQA